MKVPILLLSLVLFVSASQYDPTLKNVSTTTSRHKKNTGINSVKVLVNTPSVISEITQMMVNSNLLKTLSGLLGPIGSTVGIIESLMGIFQKELDIESLFADLTNLINGQTQFINQSFIQQTAFINQSFIAMSHQLERISDQMNRGENRIIATIQYQGILDRVSRIDVFLGLLPVLLRSYANSTTRLLQQIDEQLRAYGNLDNELTSLVFVRSPESSQQSSLISSIVSLCTPDDQSCGITASTNQVIYEFYKHIMVYVAKGRMFQKTCYEIKQQLTGKDHVHDIDFVNNKMHWNMQKIMNSIRMSMERYKDQKYLQSFLNLIRSPLEDINFVRLQRVATLIIHTHVNTEICWGDLYECKRISSDYGLYMRHQMSALEVWRPECDEFDYRMRQMTMIRRYNCACVCDANRDPKSHRTFYTGLVKVNTFGHVVTGVRFLKRDGIVFIQIQTGRLLPLGMIDSLTVRWQALPVDLNGETVTMNYHTHQMFLPDLSLPDKYVLTGVQFVKVSSDVTISIRGNNFNYLAGLVFATTVQVKGFPVSNDYHMIERLPLINTNQASYFLTSNIRIYLGRSNKQTDSGQSYLPYFDSQDITMTVPAPLSGLQLLYYNTFGSPAQYGGFVRPRITTINYLNYLLTTSHNDSAAEYDGKPENIFGRW